MPTRGTRTARCDIVVYGLAAACFAFCSSSGFVAEKVEPNESSRDWIRERLVREKALPARRDAPSPSIRASARFIACVFSLLRSTISSSAPAVTSVTIRLKPIMACVKWGKCGVTYTENGCSEIHPECCRPVRPKRCVWRIELFEVSKQTTRSTSPMSSP